MDIKAQVGKKRNEVTT